MNILLTNLPQEFETKEYTTPDYIKHFERYPPLGLMAIAANVDPRHTVKILDVSVPGFSIEETIQWRAPLSWQGQKPALYRLSRYNLWPGR